jgi:hypothetical protein
MWYKCIDEYLIQNGFIRGVIDPNIYIKRSLVFQNFVILTLYVDNCIIVSNDLQFLNQTKHTLSMGFEMTDEDPIENGDGCLGMHIERNRKEKYLSISQTK